VSSQHDRIEVVSRENQKWIANGQQPASCDSRRGLRVGLRRWRKRSHRRIQDLVAHTAFKGLDANEIGCVRTSIMAGSNPLRSKGRIQMRETSHLQIITSSLQHTAGPYRCANSGLMHRNKNPHSITSSAVASREGGTVRPSILAVWALMTSSSLLTCTTGKSAGLTPLRMRPV
jgi:hypothetical protein